MLTTFIVIVLLLIAFVLLWAFYPRGPQDGSVTDEVQAEHQTLEAKLAILAECGLTLSPEFTVDDLLESWDRQEFEQPGYDLVLVGLGMTEEEPPWRPHCRNLWHIDTECIEDDGSYVTIVERMAEMAGDSMPLEGITDHVDIDGGKAWLKFTCRGEEFRIDCDVQDDWVDPQLFGHFVKLLAKSDADKIFIYYDLGGQDAIIGCVTLQQFEALKSLSAKFEPLT